MTSLIGPSVTGLNAKIDEYSNNNLIDNVSNLKNHRLYVYSGTKDATVRPGKPTRLRSCFCGIHWSTWLNMIIQAIVKVNEQVYSKYLSSSNIKGVYSYDSVSGMVNSSSLAGNLWININVIELESNFFQ